MVVISKYGGENIIIRYKNNLVCFFVVCISGKGYVF